LEKLKNELINKENEEQQELLISPLETQEQITRLKSELENSSRTIFLAKKQLERIKEKLKKEEINEGELEIIRRPQEEMIKLQMELGIEEETEKYEVHQEVPLSSNQT
jgi:phenylalanyl-tRNA synthetase alpha subunit